MEFFGMIVRMTAGVKQTGMQKKEVDSHAAS